MSMFTGDNTAAFGNNFITIDIINNPLDATISKAEFVCGCIVKLFDNPVFPLTVNFTSEETARLGYKNVGYLRVYDEQGRPKQCDGYIVFTFKNGAFYNG